MESPSINVTPWGTETRRNPYPFVDTASMKDASGLLQLQAAWITDARFWPAMTTPGRVYLQSIERTKDYLRFTIASTEEVLCTAEVSSYNKRRIAFYSGSGQVGFMSFAPGALQAIRDRSSGFYQFAVEATELVASAFAVSQVFGLSAVLDSQGQALRSDVRLVGGEGVALNVIQGNTIRIDLIGDPYYRRDTCNNPDVLGLAINPVRTLTWRDVNTGANGITRPFTGSVVTTVESSYPEAGRRGFVSPDGSMNILAMLGV